MTQKIKKDSQREDKPSVGSSSEHCGTAAGRPALLFLTVLILVEELAALL